MAAEMGPSKPERAAGQEAPRWILDIPAQVRGFLLKMQYQPTQSGEPWGLFKFSADCKIPYSLAATAVAWSDAELCGGIETFPGYHPKAKEELGAWINKHQDPKTGQFSDPMLEKLRPELKPEDLHLAREGVTKYALGLLSRCGVKPRYDYVYGGHEGGEFDTERYLKDIKEGDWATNSWHHGSHSALQTVQLLNWVNQGHPEAIPALIEGAQFILDQQNPKTGMWGSEDADLSQQIGGALKVIGRFQWRMGLIAPHMNKLADSIIDHHKSRAFYKQGYDSTLPRNVSEMAYACLEVSDYRRDELRRVLVDLLDEFRRYQRTDGGFSSEVTGTAPIRWGGGTVEDKSEKPRSDIGGIGCVAGTIVNQYHYLGYTGGPWNRPKHWRDQIAERKRNAKYWIYADEKGKVRVEALKQKESGNP